MPPKPMASTRATGIGLQLGWLGFQLTVWATVLVFIQPGVLEKVGGHGAARWLEDHLWVRLLSIPVLLPLFLLSAFVPRDTARQRAASESLAAAVGGTLAGTPALEPDLGLPEGPALRVPLGAWSMHLVTWVRKGSRRTVARVVVETTSTFSFAARSANSEFAMLRGLQQGATTMAMGRMAEDASDPQRAAVVANLAYLGEAPIAIGQPMLDRTVVLRTNQPETARGMFTAEGVTAALDAFERSEWKWEWTLHPGTQPGLAELRFECRGGALDAEGARHIQALMRGALEYLAREGALEGGGGRQ